MEDSKGLELFKEVVAKTKAGRIRWEPAAIESEYFAVLPGGFSIVLLTWIDRQRWGNAENHFVLALRSQGREIMRVTTDVSGVTWADMNELYELARRQALAVDAQVNQLLVELSKL